GPGSFDPVARLADPEASAGAEQPSGPFLADGTLLKPVAVDTAIPDARDRIVRYRVQSGDTLTGIARRFGISMMTLWWANDLRSKDDLHVGQTLKIPPVDGLVVTVKDGDTLESIAAETGIAKETIAAFNGLTADGLVVGQVLIVPGARGEAIPTPKPTPRPVVRTATRSTTGTVRQPTRYSGGALLWPVAGGSLSQYYHYGHYGIDIAADYGTRVRAAAGGTVIFAGWKSNGGGYQVWLAHGSGLYTAYYHMSGVSVGRGQAVGRGQTVGRIGTSGWATGPHLHFEVWLGYPWESGSRRVNPLRYL
ncbi:MAG TPA: M23 family metallopeptidase, partial [Candidatus Limnocylindrales bacterium]|nr:M23 family metallopeptidase [Candidatus Limnocylindrales bacterium]